MTRVALIYPHQLFADHPALVDASQAVLVEEPLLFNQYAFHRQKLILHRAAMMQFAAGLRKRRIKVHYIEAGEMATASAHSWVVWASWRDRCWFDISLLEFVCVSLLVV
ncbi:hypothetical protein LBMAG52_45960 [Planctomycetia bacterium]|nr:hypothetical protein LBMAG52_45960 [Planctomycetia bacterium]